MIKSRIDLDKLFGKDRGQEDQNLCKYFIKTGQYDSIYSGNKELILGRKGAGKSSLFCQMCIELPRDNIIPIPISPSGEDFSLLENKLKNYIDMKFNDDFKYSLAWYELILTEIAFTVISEKSSRFLKGADEVLFKYVKKNEKLKGDFVSQFANSVLKAFSGGKITLAGAELNVDFSAFSEIGSPDQIAIKRALFKIITENKFYVLVDNLDEPWKNTSEMNCWLRGLILASRRLKRDFKNLKIAVFLRDDIYSEIIKGSDLFDSRSEILLINWKDPKNFALRQLLAARIANYLELPYPTDLDSFDNLLIKFFPLQIKLGGSLKYTTQFVGSRTFYKPRDFLQFFRNAIEVSFTETIPIPQGAMLQAEAEYSSWKIGFLQGEYAKTYKGINECISTFVRITNDWILPYKDLIYHLKKIDENMRIYNLIENRALTANESADFLFSIGFLRKVITSYKRTSFLTYIEEPNPRLSGSVLDIHPAFRTNLAKR